MSGKTTTDAEAPLSDDDGQDIEAKKDEEKPLNNADNNNNSDKEEVNFNTGYFDERSKRFFYLSIISFFVFFNYFIVNTTTDRDVLIEAEDKTKKYVSWINARLAGSMLICIACVGIFFLKFKQKDALNKEDVMSCGKNVHTFVGIIFIIGGLTLLYSTIFVSISAMDVAREFLQDDNFNCGNFTKNELINYDTGELEEQNIGVNVCALPFAYDTILFLLPIIIGLDILLSKCFRTSEGKYFRISFYSLTLIGFVVFFGMFGYSIAGFCQYQNIAHNAPTRTPTDATKIPSATPTKFPTLPTVNPPSFLPTPFTFQPTIKTLNPSTTPTTKPTPMTITPSSMPTIITGNPTDRPSVNPIAGSQHPTTIPTEIPSPTPTKAPTTRLELKSEILCSKEGYFNGFASILANPPNSLWTSLAEWNFKTYLHILVMLGGAALLGIGMLLSIIIGLCGKCCGGECCKFPCCNWKCGNRNGVGCIPLLAAILLMIGSIIVCVIGITVQENTGYLGYSYQGAATMGSANFINTYPFGGFATPSFNFVLLIYGYWVLIVAVCWFIAVDLLNVH